VHQSALVLEVRSMGHTLRRRRCSTQKKTKKKAGSGQVITGRIKTYEKSVCCVTVDDDREVAQVWVEPHPAFDAVARQFRRVELTSGFFISRKIRFRLVLLDFGVNVLLLSQGGLHGGFEMRPENVGWKGRGWRKRGPGPVRAI